MSARVLTYALMLMMLVGVAHAQVAAPVSRPAPRSATPAGKQVNDRDVFTKHDDTGGPTRLAESALGTKLVAFFGLAPDADARTRPHSSTGMVIGFWLFAALAVGGSLFVITRKNLIAGVMGMVGTFFAIAALYMMLYAHFLAVIQMLVYAGAIMVLFVFVIMILNKPEDEPYATTGKAGKAVAGLAMAYLVYRLATVLLSVDSNVTNAQLAPPAATSQGYDWGSTAAVGWNLFNEYLFPFEAISILLLVAVVGSIAIARPLKDDGVEGEG